MIRANHVIFAVVAAGFVRSAPGDSLPYQARVVIPAATVKSGPGNAFYPTDTLPGGAEIEVYREESNGWCAIRPPESSFSWVFGRHLRVVDDTLGEVTKEDVASRIGSRLHDKRNAVQIRLNRGEVVQILGEEEVDGHTWYKIAPPAGEFRWVHTSSLERIESMDAMEPAADDVVAVSSTESSEDASASTSTSEPLVAVESLPPSDADEWRPSSAAAADPKPLVDQKASPPDEAAAVHPIDSKSSEPPSTPPTATAGRSSVDAKIDAPAQASSLAPNDIARQLTDVELQLSRTVSGPPSTWNIGSLRHATEQLLMQAGTSADRALVKTTLAKLDRFATIQHRYAGTGLAIATPQTAGHPPATVSSSPMVAGEENRAPYDAVGTLRPVVSKRPGAPQYALVDERGQVVSFVTPTPDLNLQPYLGHRVGIAGNRGFMPEFNRAHVTAGRVAPLADRRMR